MSYRDFPYRVVVKDCLTVPKWPKSFGIIFSRLDKDNLQKILQWLTDNYGETLNHTTQYDPDVTWVYKTKRSGNCKFYFKSAIQAMAFKLRWA